MADGAFQRARRPEQKRQRRAEIVAAAQDLLASDGVDGVTLNRIARRVGLAKSNLYRYFDSREQILARLVTDRMAAWADAVAAGLAPLAGRSSPAAVAPVLARSLADRPRLCELLAVLSVPPGGHQASGDKADLAGGWTAARDRAGDALAGALPALPAGSVRWALAMVLVLAAGLAPVGRPGGRAPSRSGSGRGALRAGFEQDLERSIRIVLYGLLVEGWRASGRPAGRP